jgi:hypothetical protein
MAKSPICYCDRHRDDEFFSGPKNEIVEADQFVDASEWSDLLP